MDFQNAGIILIAYIASNIIGLLFLWAAIKKTKQARLMFFLLFAWASWLNYTGCHQHPEIYLSYSQKAIGIYRDFINGWFRNHITEFVSVIAIGQGLIAIGMLLNGIWVRLACLGAIIFLLSIAPLGYYAGFPFSLTVSAAAYFILRKDDKNYLWQFNQHSTKNYKHGKD